MAEKNIRITAYVKGHPRAKDLQALWRKTSTDMRGSTPELCRVVVHTSDGGCKSAPLRSLTNEEIDRALGPKYFMAD